MEKKFMAICFLLIFAAVLLPACSSFSNVSSSSVSKQTKQQTSIMAQTSLETSSLYTQNKENKESIFNDSDSAAYWDSGWYDFVSTNYTEINGEKQKINGYIFTLKKYFYDIDAGVMVCCFAVSDDNGEKPSQDQIKQLKTDSANRDLRIILNRTTNNGIETIKTDSKEIYWIVSKNLEPTFDEKKPFSDVPEQLTIKYNADSASISIHSNGIHENTMVFDTDSNKNILFCQLGEYELNIIMNVSDEKNITDNDTAESNISDAEPGLYSTVELQTKDGKIRSVISEDLAQNEITGSGDYEYDGELQRIHMRKRFNRAVDLSDIEYLIIDGTKYSPREIKEGDTK